MYFPNVFSVNHISRVSEAKNMDDFRGYNFFDALLRMSVNTSTLTTTTQESVRKMKLIVSAPSAARIDTDLTSVMFIFHWESLTLSV